MGDAPPLSRPAGYFRLIRRPGWLQSGTPGTTGQMDGSPARPPLMRSSHGSWNLDMRIVASVDQF
jgi:hypothetical protein